MLIAEQITDAERNRRKRKGSLPKARDLETERQALRSRLGAAESEAERLAVLCDRQEGRGISARAIRSRLASVQSEAASLRLAILMLQP